MHFLTSEGSFLIPFLKQMLQKFIGISNYGRFDINSYVLSFQDVAVDVILI